MARKKQGMSLVLTVRHPFWGVGCVEKSPQRRNFKNFCHQLSHKFPTRNLLPDSVYFVKYSFLPQNPKFMGPSFSSICCKLVL